MHLPLGEAKHFTHPEAFGLSGRQTARLGRIVLPILDGKRTPYMGGPVFPGGRRTTAGSSMRNVPGPDRRGDALFCAGGMCWRSRAAADDRPERRRMLNAWTRPSARWTPATRWARVLCGRAAALGQLRDGLEQASAPMDVDIVAVGHAHIDVAYLWTVAQARLKTVRTFPTCCA